MKKDATIRARVPLHIADLIGDESRKIGLVHMSDYIRQAVLEKLARDKNESIETILRRD